MEKLGRAPRQGGTPFERRPRCHPCETSTRASSPQAGLTIAVFAVGSLIEAPNLRRGGARGMSETEVPVGAQGQYASARRAADEALLQKIRLDDLLQGIAGFGKRGRDRFNADRAAVVIFGDAAEIPVIQGIEAFAIHLKL